jgi:hypothetical protein
MTFSGIAILDEVVIKLIFAASGAVAYSLVGSILSTGLIMSRADAGQLRMGLFLILLVIFLTIYMAIINFVKWLLSFPIYVYIIIFIVSCGLLLFRIYLNWKANQLYEEEYQNNELEDIVEEVKNVEENSEKVEYPSSKPKTIFELLNESKDKQVIYVERIDDKSPGLQYIQVNRDALNYPVLKGYLKYDNAGKFREIYYANEKIWRMCKLMN